MPQTTLWQQGSATAHSLDFLSPPVIYLFIYSVAFQLLSRSKLSLVLSSPKGPSLPGTCGGLSRTCTSGTTATPSRPPCCCGCRCPCGCACPWLCATAALVPWALKVRKCTCGGFWGQKKHVVPQIGAACGHKSFLIVTSYLPSQAPCWFKGPMSQAWCTS